jgi:hypothetical protein
MSEVGSRDSGSTGKADQGQHFRKVIRGLEADSEEYLGSPVFLLSLPLAI